jgi:hypothetical protein
VNDNFTQDHVYAPVFAAHPSGDEGTVAIHGHTTKNTQARYQRAIGASINVSGLLNRKSFDTDSSSSHRKAMDLLETLPFYDQVGFDKLCSALRTRFSIIVFNTSNFSDISPIHRSTLSVLHFSLRFPLGRVTSNLR